MFKSINRLCLLACAVAYVACSSDSGTAVPQQASSYEEPDSSTSSSISSPSETRSSSSSYTQPISYGTLVDTRDGQTYKTVVIGSQTWMAENLNYETADSHSYIYDGHQAKKCLYTWYAAMKACPNGWHLPSGAEFKTLFDAVGGSESAGRMLKSTGGWIGAGNGTDAFGFSALPAGGWDGNRFFDFDGTGAYSWSSTECNSDSAYHLALYYGGDVACLLALYFYDDAAHLAYSDKYNMFSVRCLRDSSSDTAQPESSSSVTSASSSSSVILSGGEGTLTDSRDGQTYKTVTIGTQTWMAENLNYESRTSMCYDDAMNNCMIYGRLYQQVEAFDICPDGWRLPSRQEAEELLINDVSALLASGTNTTGFSALLGGSSNGNLGVYAIIWTSETDCNIRLSSSGKGTYAAATGEYVSVRCVKDKVANRQGR